MTESTDEDRLRALLDEYGDVIRRAIRRYVGRGSGLDIDDIEQDVRLRVWRALQKRREMTHPAAYLYRVAVTASLDAWRRLRARREEPLTPPGNESAAPSAPTASPERVALSRQRLQQVETALAQLAVNRRRAVALHLQGFTTAEIGALRGWTEPKARNLVYRGLGDLKALLEGKRIELV